MQWLLPVGGAVLVLAGLLDVFQTLFRSRGMGYLSTIVFRSAWSMARRVGQPASGMVGPVGLLLVIVTWVVLQAAGWALIYLPQIPDGFSYSPGLDPTRHPALADALYVSLVALATLGFGDVVAVAPGLRVLFPLEALTGFVLLTAAVSWLMQIYPALGRRRALALRLDQLRRSDPYGSRVDGSAQGATLLDSIADQFTQVRVDLAQNGETYYFSESDSSSCLGCLLRHARSFAERARESSGQTARAGAGLDLAVSDFARYVGHGFLRSRTDDVSRIIDEIERDRACHQHRDS